ncbi:hypothetical protein DDB_G0278811 [Dictyostelium discoideum AX4]|uniref:Uncharacterized protein n=1 Tax=Dictyostelium discoideum TaxID=44689 RepID=Q54XP8_DICDI|nr:hypothetical protein DDB_G0278811 [Dictyostelium discoideum AX4]EAL68007.1 hypothetical protein DDB_G0278811 [Dictyostelium discoideum AX4]|eukprot:XP_641982.1 hypothetical protein DDB_G0278811 [Dictyostelium discoideum AX4]
MVNNDRELFLNIVWKRIHEITKEISIIADNLSKTEISKEERDFLKNNITEYANQLNNYLKMVDILINNSNENNFPNELYQEISFNKICQEKSEYRVGE